MPAQQEWLPIATIRRRLWSLAMVKHTDVTVAIQVRDLIARLVSAHSLNWYDGKPPTNDAGVQIMELSGVLQHVRRVQPDIWPAGAPGAAEPSAAKTRGQRGPERGKGKYVEADRKLYLKIDALIKQANSLNSAGWILENAHEIADPNIGSPKSRVTRLTKGYSKARKTPSN
jgi:hypothetical protein